MPALERLHLALADGGLAVLAISQDRGGEAVVDPFLARLDLQHLPIYLDAKGELGRGFALKGLPTTRSEEHTSELQSLMRNSYAVFCLTKKQQSKDKPYH